VTLARRIADRFLLRTAVIREEDGQYCVRSPDNPDWNGGCYDTKGEAEDRLKQVEFFKRQAGELKSVWMVRDWTNNMEYLHDMVWEEDIDRLPRYILGGGNSWWDEHTKLFTDEQSAMADFERRMKPIDRRMAQKGLYRHMHSDGRIIYVSIPDDS
jgi:hypothetical protein